MIEDASHENIGKDYRILNILLYYGNSKLMVVKQTRNQFDIYSMAKINFAAFRSIPDNLENGIFIVGLILYPKRPGISIYDLF